MNQVHVRGSLAILGGKLYVLGVGRYGKTFELSDMVEAYDPETQAWSVVGWLPEPTFWHGSVSIFSQFMPQTPTGGHGFEMNSGSSGVDAGHHRLPQSPEEVH